MMLKKMKTITLKNEIVLLKYLETLLSNGITTPITEDMYFHVIEELIKEAQKDPLMITKKKNLTFSSENFSDIIEKANRLNNKNNKEKKEKIKIEKDENGKEMASATYFLKKGDMPYGHDVQEREYILLDTLLKQKISSPTLCDYPLDMVSEDILNKAKKVSAFYINDLIERYIQYKISYGKWPSQCKNIDEYIFKRNIAPLIDENGTAEVFKQAYLNAIKVTCQIIDSHTKTKEKDPLFYESTFFSNNEQNVLAHANFLKFVLPESLQFLKMFKYNRLEAYNTAIDIQILRQTVFFDTTYDISSPYQGSSRIVRENGIVNEETVHIMEKRIGKLH